MSSSKGGTTTGKTEVPAYIQDAHKRSIDDAQSVSELGYVPYYGADVAAFSPMQQQSMRSTGNTASAFGMAPAGFDGTAGIPQAQTFAGGIQGYSSAPLYEEALAQLEARRPAQYAAINDRFIDPFTGSRPKRGGGYGTSGGSDYAAGAAYGGGGYTAPTSGESKPDYIPATDGGTGYWQGGEKTGKQTNHMSGDEYEAYVLAHGLPAEGDTFMDGLRDFGKSFANNGLIGMGYNALTGEKIFGDGYTSEDAEYFPTMSDNENSFYSRAPTNPDGRFRTYDPSQANGINQNSRTTINGGLLGGGLNQDLAQLRANSQEEREQRLTIEAVEEEQYQQRKNDFERRQRESAQRMAVLNQGGGGSRAIGVSSTGAGLNQRGSTYSGGGQAAASGYGGISGGGGR